MLAVIGNSENTGSIALHASAGFQPVGTFRSVGFKFGRWVDSVLMQRPLGQGDTTRPEHREPTRRCAMRGNSRLSIIVPLGVSQTLAWASSYYLPAILADPIARDLGISETWFFAAFSASLVLSGLLGPRIGRRIDQVGGRQVLSGSNLLFAAGLVLLGSVAVDAEHDDRLARSRRGHGHGPLRRRLWRARAHLWRDGARRDHRHHADRGICQHGRLAVDGVGA